MLDAAHLSLWIRERKAKKFLVKGEKEENRENREKEEQQAREDVPRASQDSQAQTQWPPRRNPPGRRKP